MEGTVAIAAHMLAAAAEQSAARTVTDTAIATVLSAIIGGLVAWATVRQSRKGQEVVAQVAAEAAVTSSRAQVEEGAFNRASDYLNGLIDKQNNEIRDLEADKVADHEKIRELHARVDEQDSEIRDLKGRVATLENENADLRDKLSVATRLLERQYPDE